ncbi:dynein beta chain, ciliary-like isoform X3 [Acipenser ruthenus]|uniref:dynein beta chain, ciliary-like isoform X3 n=1 Tax=Acipenser ruthenus TaxID=7906 RepID=UPI0027423E45|nr:dynein beta chain, ciliary-like isoform X3 [Acipenser ruthenus]
MCSRELVQEHLKDKYEQLLSMFIEELTQVKSLYQTMSNNPPLCVQSPPTVNKLLWVKGLQARVSEPMVKLKEVSPHSLKGYLGWKLRHLYTEVMEELKRCEKETIDSWLKNSQVDLSNAIKRTLLVASNVHGELEDQLQAVELNLDPDLLLLLREASYLRKAPFNFSLREPIETLLKNVDVNGLKTQAVRLEAVVCKYNEVMRTINDYERRLLERKLYAAEELLQSGLTVYTWSMEESADFIELATSLVCSDLYMTFSTLRSNCREILDLSSAWSNGKLDIFTSRDTKRTYSMEELIQEQETLEHSLERQILLDGQRIHNLIKESFVAVGVSEASPAWQEYVEHIDILVLQGLKEVTFSSLASMLNTLLEGQEAPILRIRVELVGSAVGFWPPLDESAVQSSVLEHTRDWLKSFLLRGSLVTMLCFSAQGGYHDYVAADKEVIQLVGHILEQVQDSADKCQDTLGALNQYAYLWKKDVNATFQDFIHGVGRVKPDHQSQFSRTDFLMDLMDTLSDRSQSRQSSNLRSQSTLLIEAERAFIQPEDAKETISVPLLEDFDTEISIYRNDRDSILTFQDSMVLGWIQVDFQPIKQVLAAYAFKWMWTFAKYLTDKMTDTLKKLDAFLKRTEPQIESITGDERDTEFFMTMMQLFSEVSTKQTEMEGQFIVMQKALKLLEKYEMKLPAESERLFKATPGRWNILKTKMSLAKQRLSPKIRQESERITKDLSQFGEILHQLREDIDESDIYMRACSVEQAYCVIKTFNKQVKSLQREAKDLKELQELLEATVVDFSVLNECHRTVRNLTLLWQKVEVIQKQQTQWKTQPWQDLDTVQLINNTNQQLQIVQSLPREVRGWDIYAGTLESVNVIQLTLPLIEDLLNPAMRTRHWKQLVRLTGGQLYSTPENIRRMTLADLITLGLQRHADHVKTIVDRAVKDVTIESGLKTCEEVWLSRIFDMHPHCRVTPATGRGEVGPIMLLNNPEVIFEELEHHQMTLETMKNNSEAGSFLDEVTKWQKKLQVIESVVRLWSQVQEKWVQLEEVFWTDDICRDLPKEATTFAEVHHDLCAVMKATEQNPNVLQTCTKPGLQDMLGEMNEKLEKCQHALLHNLEQRRIAFPRFFFLPLQDTLKIVCYAHNPDVLNRYLYKVFEHMESLIFETHNGIHVVGSQRIVAVQSFQGEQLYLPEPLECKGPIENWLALLVSRIRTALQHHLHATLGHELLPQRQIHSAGARRVAVSRPASKQGQGGKRDRLGSSSLRTLERKESGSFVVQHQDVSSSKSQREPWILVTLGEVAHLATQIHFSSSLQESVNMWASGDKDTLRDYHARLTEAIQSTAKLLQENRQKDIRCILHDGLVKNEESCVKGLKSTPSVGSMKSSPVCDISSQKTIRKPSTSGHTKKLSNHILLLTYQCDVVKRILEQIKSGAISDDSNIPNALLHYQYDENSMDISVKVGECEYGYGYEYQGSAERSLITPLTERTFLSLSSALSSGAGALCMGPENVGKKTTVKELSLALGRALYFIHCTKAMDLKTLTDICKGVASAGALVCLNGMDRMRPLILSEAALWLGQIQGAMQAGKGIVHVQSSDTTLNPLGGCLAIIKSNPVKQTGNALYPRYVSPAATIPDNLLRCFRIVSITSTNLHFPVETLLFTAGFSGAGLLARKLLALLEACSKMSATSAGSVHCGNANSFAWTLSSIRHLIHKAGSLLCEMQIKQEAIQSQNESKDLHAEGDIGLEDQALVAAFHHCLFPQLTGDKLKLVCSVTAMLWPSVTLPVHTTPLENQRAKFAEPVSLGSVENPSLTLEISSVKGALDEESEAIAKAATQRQLCADDMFISRVLQLAHLVQTYQITAIVGPAGCGKSECIRTYLQSVREKGTDMDVQTVFIRALESQQLLGYTDPESGWMDGLLPKLLRLYWLGLPTASKEITGTVKTVHLDGQIDAQQMEHMQAILSSNGLFILANNEHIKLPGSIKLFWELESLEDISPTIVCCLGILSITSSDRDWKLPLTKWLQGCPEHYRCLLQQLTGEFLEPVVELVCESSSSTRADTRRLKLKKVTNNSVENMVQTFCRIFEALNPLSVDMPFEAVKKCFLFASLWAFGGTLESQCRVPFNHWWREQFGKDCVFPVEREIWDYYIDKETWQFVRWSDSVPLYSVPCGQGIPSQAFVHTVESEQLVYLTSLLSAAGHPVLLLGEAGCGKSMVLNQHIQALYSGDEVEVLQLRVAMNRSTTPQKLWQSLLNKVEWHHGAVYAPLKNRKLLCLVDDLHLAQVDHHGSQPACELMRQLLDCGGGFDPLSFEWKKIKNVTFLATANVNSSARVPKPSQRLLRHYSIFHCPYPSSVNQYGIFSALLNAHFLQSPPAHQTGSLRSTSNYNHRDLLSAVTTVTIETQERLRTMFLRTSQRCHYIFTLRDLAKTFRNLCLSLSPETSPEALLYLWRHECDWVYGHRMVSYVDYERYTQEYVAAVKKAFTDEEQVRLIINPQQPLLSNVIELEGGLISAAPTQWQVRSLNQPSKQERLYDGYQHTFDEDLVRELLEESVREHNKANPRMAISFYKSTIELVCRLTRNLLSPHEVAHTMLCGEGCAGMCVPLARLAAHLCSFTVVHVSSAAKADKDSPQMTNSLKSQLVDSYVQAGVQGQRVLLVLSEEHMEMFSLLYISDLVVLGSITPLFTSEQQTSIVNELRSEITNEGITFTKEAAWDYFLRRVTQNLRCIFICPSTGSNFLQCCQEFPAFTNTINIYFVPHWSRSNLVAQASYHIRDLELSGKEKENVSHLLASMHLVVCKHDGNRKGTGRFGHLTNGTYETFVRNFVTQLKKKHAELMAEHKEIEKTLGHIEDILMASAKLKKDFQHETVVLEERKQGAMQILIQIGQDKAVAEQQVHALHQQMKKIRKLQKLLPEYQLAHDRAVYKCSAIVLNIKKLVGEIDTDALGELRAMQKPDVDTEVLMASIITVLKSPSADLTWSKGAKRQLANLERFLEELSTFNEIQLPENTLALLEAYLQKPSFTTENMESRAGGNTATGCLLKWLQGAVSYHRIMVSKVRPLHSKVEEMTAALEQAVQKMNTLQAKKSTLLRRLDELEKGFEEASIDKTDQERKTLETMSQLEYLSSLAEILQMEHNKYSVVSSSLPERFTGLLGSTAMAAGFLTYLGPYEYLFRRLILSVEWPLCLKERGLPFLIDSVDPIQGRVTDFSIEFFKRDSEETKETDVIADCNQDQEDQNQQGVKQEDPAVTQPEVDVCSDYESSPHDLPAPVITEEHYPDFIKALLKLIVGHKQVQEWIAKDWTLHQMQNAAVLFTSWQKPPLLIDSSDETEKWLKELHSASTISVKLGERPESSVLLNIEKALQSGSSLLLYNYTNKWDDLVRPLIEHCNTATERNLQLGSSNIICLEGHRLLCSDQFRLYIATSQTEGRFRTDINCGTTLINYREGEDTLRDVLLHRMFSNTQPNLQGQLKKVARTVLDAQDSLKQMEIRFRECINSSPQNSDGIADIFNDKNQLSERLQESQSLYSSLSQLRDKLLPVAHRGALLYSILQALRVLAREYQFPLSYFLCLFDKAIGNSALEEDSLQVEDAQHPQARTGLVLETEEEGIKDRQHRNPLNGKDLDSRIDASLTDPEPPAESLSTQFESMEVIRSPQEPAILSPGTKEHSLSANQISQLVDQLTETVYQAINQSLYPEHSLVFSAMLTLYIQLQSGGSLSEEELALLFQGFQGCGSVALTLNDFGSDADPPAWLPPERWESLLGLSVLPGPLDSVCVQVAESSTEWETWYNSDHPELETLPLAAQGFTVENVDDAPGSSGIPGLASEFQKLLVLRTLRPDRLTGALSLYIKRQKNSSVQARPYPTVSDIADLAVDSLGILVLLPSGLSHAKGPSNVCLARSVQHATVICIAAKERSIPVSVATIKEDFQGYIETALDDMVEQDGWLILENLHLASSDFICSLYEKLIQGRKKQNKKRQFRVWLTSELEAPFPHQFISELHKVSWHILNFGQVSKKTEATDLLTHGPQRGLIPMAIVSALNQIRNEPCGEAHSLPMIVRCLCFGVCVLHGIMEALQFLPVSGLNQVYPVSYTQLHQAIDVIISSGQHLQSSSESSVQILTKKIATIYTNLVTNPEDALYVQSLATEILPQCLQSKGEISVGEFTVPVPPDTVDPAEFSFWLCDRLPECSNCTGLALHNSTEKTCHQSSSVELLRSLSEVYEALQCGLPPADQEDSITPTGLSASRLAAGLISEQLPLEPDASSPFEPFPSVPGMTKEEDTEEFEAVRHALLQECSWLNRSLCHIRQQVSRLEKSLLTDTLALPDHLAEVAESLKKDEVPGSWLHPYCQPSTHTLSTWIQDLKKRHSQLKQWVEEGMVHHGEKTAGNRIQSVWLGGLLNPEGLIMALQHAYAAANGCLLDEIALSCHISKSPEHTAQPESQQCQLILEGLVLHGASWDFKANQLGEPKDEFVPLPYVTVKPVLRTAEMSEDRAKLFECPVYRNTTRQCCIMKLPLQSPNPAHHWQLKKTAIVLDSGPPPPGITRRLETCFPAKMGDTQKIVSSPRLLNMASFTESPSKDIPPRIVSNQPASNGIRSSSPEAKTADVDEGQGSVPEQMPHDNTQSPRNARPPTLTDHRNSTSPQPLKGVSDATGKGSQLELFRDKAITLGQKPPSVQSVDPNTEDYPVPRDFEEEEEEETGEEESRTFSDGGNKNLVAEDKPQPGEEDLDSSSEEDMGEEPKQEMGGYHGNREEADEKTNNEEDDAVEKLESDLQAPVEGRGGNKAPSENDRDNEFKFY